MFGSAVRNVDQVASGASLAIHTAGCALRCMLPRGISDSCEHGRMTVTRVTLSSTEGAVPIDQDRPVRSNVVVDAARCCRISGVVGSRI